jgi:hypothetical protein
MMTPDEKRILVDSIFSDELQFEKRVLDIQNEAERKEVMTILANEIVDKRLRDVLHFSYLKAYDDLHTDGIAKVILQRLSSEAAGYLEEKLRYTKTMTAETIHKRPHLLFLKRLSLFYYKRFGHLVFARIADTYFERVAALPSPEHPPKLLLDALEGTTRHPSLVKGSGISFKMVWEHARRANLARKKEIGKIQISLSSMLNIKQNNPELGEEEVRKLEERYRWNQKNLEAVRSKSLDEFDAGIKRMKAAAVQVLQGFGNI